MTLPPADEAIVDFSPESPRTSASAHRNFGTPEGRAAGRATRSEQRAAWPPVRQPHPQDVDYLKAILRGRELSRIPEAEPATPVRLKRLLRRAGVRSMVGLWGVNARGRPITAEEFIAKNPGMALWWLVAVTLEITT
jgi:hypothetical protein